MTRRRISWPALVLAGVVACYGAANAIWLLLDASPPSFDKAAHAGFALQFHRLFEEPTRLSLTKLLSVTEYWPPLFHVASVPFTFALGFSVDAVAATNLLFLIVAAAAIYRIGRRLADPWVGVGAVVLTLSYPVVVGLSREVLVDFALMAMVVLAVDLLLATDAGLGRRPWRLGLAIGAAMLTKWTAWLFLIGPFVVWWCSGLRRDRPSPRRAWRSIGVTLGVAAAIALPWYLHAADEFLRRATIAVTSDPAREGDPTGAIASVQWYWRALQDMAIMKLLLVPSVVGALAFLGRRQHTGLPARGVLVAWIVPAAVVLLLIPNKDGRYLVPLLPAVALMAAAGVRTLPWPALRIALWIFIAGAGAYQYSVLSFGWPATRSHFYARPPDDSDWKIESIVRDIADLPHERTLQYVAILPNEAGFEPNLFMLEAATRRLPMQVEVVGYAREPVRDWSRYDVIVSKTGSIAVAHAVESRSELREALEAWAAETSGRPALTLWRTWPLPDGSRAEAYRIAR